MHSYASNRGTELTVQRLTHSHTDSPSGISRASAFTDQSITRQRQTHHSTNTRRLDLHSKQSLDRRNGMKDQLLSCLGQPSSPTPLSRSGKKRRSRRHWSKEQGKEKKKVQTACSILRSRPNRSRRAILNRAATVEGLECSWSESYSKFTQRKFPALKTTGMDSGPGLWHVKTIAKEDGRVNAQVRCRV